MIAVTIGKPDGGEPNAGTLAITLVDSKKRKLTTTQVKDQIRELLKPLNMQGPPYLIIAPWEVGFNIRSNL
ncbi:hypothetical protein LEP1GSC151_1704 [Leptospira interrogans serovar Grippotyphosa str. LT2186]|uniref:RND transporter, Hydrophobe/Amphiphile Efflux-1 (HAE1)/Heavy Metal Efflux (HME) family, permease protein n=1 Tax=Leptospira interrogans serovar Grippotyphosa str. LT2186 TaxID=1001599 RepID=M3IBA9_LEPIR|nr:hypothetical protein LEP1GSC151_1704 [Leptospira interrogans serovar Grippotyphosa str. LT2186]